MGHQYRALFTLSVTLDAVSDVIDEFAEESGDRGTTARNLQQKLTSCFVVHLLTMRWLLHMCAVATGKLQGKTETMVDALETVKTLSGIVSNRPEHPYPDEIWNCIWSEAVELTTLCKFPVLPAHRIPSVRRARFEGPDDYRRRLFLLLCNTRKVARSTLHEP